jgi:hypothetical protein
MERNAGMAAAKVADIGRARRLMKISLLELDTEPFSMAESSGHDPSRWLDRNILSPTGLAVSCRRVYEMIDVAKDAKGQFAKSIADRRATGVAGAKPTVITGSEDAGHKTPPGKRPVDEWDLNYDSSDMHQGRRR